MMIFSPSSGGASSFLLLIVVMSTNVFFDFVYLVTADDETCLSSSSSSSSCYLSPTCQFDSGNVRGYTDPVTGFTNTTGWMVRTRNSTASATEQQQQQQGQHQHQQCCDICGNEITTEYYDPYDILYLVQQWVPSFCNGLDDGHDLTLAHPSGMRCSSDVREKFGPRLSIHGLWNVYKNGGFAACCLENQVLDPIEVAQQWDGLWTRMKQDWFDPTVSGCTTAEDDDDDEYECEICYLQNHEWQKHGTCMDFDTPKEYFEVGIELYDRLIEPTTKIEKWTGTYKSLKEIEELYSPYKVNVVCDPQANNNNTFSELRTCWTPDGKEMMDCPPPFESVWTTACSDKQMVWIPDYYSSSSVTTAKDDASGTTTTSTTTTQFVLPEKLTDLRIATFNTALSDHVGRVEYKLEEWLIFDEPASHPEVALVAEVVQRTRPDILSLNEFDHVWINSTHWDYDRTYAMVDAFQNKYLEVSQSDGLEPISYPYVFVAPCNTGVQTGIDMNKDGQYGTGDDAFAYGDFPGAFSMVFLSKYPIVEDKIRTFQYFLWKDMTNAYVPLYPLNYDDDDDQTTIAGTSYYNDTELDIIRLAAKSFWDIPIDVSGSSSNGNRNSEDDEREQKEVLHVLMSHPRPPAFDDGTATSYPDCCVTDRNGFMNHDEIRFWADYVGSGDNDDGSYIYDDNEWLNAGKKTPSKPSGGFQGGERFVILGDQNADPCEGDTVMDAIHQLLDSPIIDTSFTPSSLGGPEYVSEGCETDYKTAFFGLRADYTLPSVEGLSLQNGQVVWPTKADDLTYLNDASDHHMVYIDVDLIPTTAAGEEDGGSTTTTTTKFVVPTKETDIRVANYNVAMSDHVGRTEYELEKWLTDPQYVANYTKAKLVAEVIQRTRPDVLSLNEFDHVWVNESYWDKERTYAMIEGFQKNFLNVSQADGLEPIYYKYSFVAPCNTGLDTGIDMNKDGVLGTGDDAFAYGDFPGAFSMAFLSKYPIVEDQVRTFQYFLWKDMTGAYLPPDPQDVNGNGENSYYNETELDIIRLAAKSFWDIPIDVGDGDDHDHDPIHILMSHPRPPSYDDGQAMTYPDPNVTDKNGLMNHDEIRFWADYVTPGKNDYIYDDSEWLAAGGTTPSKPTKGGFSGKERFVIVGDENADPCDDDSALGAIWQLLNNTMINTDVTPSSLGAVELITEGCDIKYKTVVFDSEYEIAEDRGGVRADYSLPSQAGFIPQHGQVVWPLTTDDLSYLNDASDHHMIYIDLDLIEPTTTTAASSFADILCESDDYSTMCSLVETCGMIFDDDRSYTIFAPTNSAFDGLNDVMGGLEGLENDAVCEILKFHISDSSAMHYADFICQSGDASLIEMMNGKNARIKCTKGIPYGIKGGGNPEPAEFIDVDLVASNGAIHTIDIVLFFPKAISDPNEGGILPSLRDLP